MRSKILLTLFFGLLLVSGCTREDMSVCVTKTSFACSFEMNNEHTDQFGKLINKVDLYIFDGSGRFVKHISQSQENYFPDGYTIEVYLNYGRYTAVCYGTQVGNDGVVVGVKKGDLTTALGALKVGESKMEDFRLMLNSVNGFYDKDLGVVLHGMVSNFEVTSEPEVYKMSFIRNTHVMELNVSGLENLINDATPSATRAAGGELSVRVEGNNKAYLYDNTLDMELGAVNHAPYFQQFASNVLGCKVSMLRLFKEHPMTLRVYQGNDVIWRLNLIEEIMKSPDYSTNEDLDRQDTFVLDVRVNSALDVTVVVNGWTTTTAGEIVG